MTVKLAVFFILAGNFSFQEPVVEDNIAGNGVVNLADISALSEAKAQDANAQGAKDQDEAAPEGETAADPGPAVDSALGNAAAGTGNEPLDGMGGQADAMLRDALERRAADLDRREAELMRLEQALNEKILNMQAMEARIETMLREAQTQRDEKMRHLVDVYSNMKAQQAAAVLETLDERTAVQILAGMRGRQAGDILTYVRPEKAARLSEMLTRMQIPFQ